MKWWKRSLSAIFVVRFMSVVLTQTYASPDEYWQGPEIAHKLVYGIGRTTWEWWPTSELRSVFHPTLLSFFPAVLKALGLDTWWTVHISFKATHALISATTDWATLLLAFTVTKSVRIAHLALLCQLSSWFTFFGAARPFVNSLEAALNTVSLWLWLSATESQMGHRWGRLAAAGFVAGFAVAARPTALIIWLGISLLSLLRRGLRDTVLVAVAAGLPAACSIACGAVIDRLFFGHWTFPMLNFVRFNLIEGNDRLYGQYHALWYLVEAIPAVCGVFLPLVLWGAWKAWHGGQAALREIVFSAAWYVGVLSLAAHKEHRFLLPVAPVLSTLAGRGLYSLSVWLQRAASGDSDFHLADCPPPFASTSQIGIVSRCLRSAGIYACFRKQRIFPAIIALLCVANAIAALYINLVHQRGAVDAVIVLAKAAAAAENVFVAPRSPGDAGPRPATNMHRAITLSSHRHQWLQPLMSVHFLMPCHSTPFFAVMHAPVSMLQLDCSPVPRLLPSVTHARALSRGWSETFAWNAFPGGLLRAMYGSDPVPPRACAFERAMNEVQASDHHFSRRDNRDGSCPFNLPGDDTLATTGFGFAREFGAIGGFNVSEHDEPVFRQLPTHIVAYDTDSALPAVRRFLDSNGYVLARSLFQSHVSGDVHAAESGRPDHAASVQIFVHPCWAAVT